MKLSEFIKKYGDGKVDERELMETLNIKERGVMIEHDGCVGCKYEHEDEASPYCDKCTQNSTDKYTPVSNADRIRGMTDEELAEYIFDLGNGSEYCYGHCVFQDNCTTRGLDHDTCIKGVIDWLKQSSETEGTE